MKPESFAWDYIVEHLHMHWSPEMICGRWNRVFASIMQQKLCISTIYRYVRQRKLPGKKEKTHLRRRGKRYCSRQSNYNSIQPERIIPQWDDVIKQRLRIGDWEGDTVYGAVGKGLLVTLVDRRSRFLCATLIRSGQADETRKAIVKCLCRLPVHSISLDNGSEFSEFRQLEDALHTQIYFAEPHKPWQRGTNENINRMIRRQFPKGTDFDKVTAAEVKRVETWLNNYPREILGFMSSAQAFELAFDRAA